MKRQTKGETVAAMNAAISQKTVHENAATLRNAGRGGSSR